MTVATRGLLAEQVLMAILDAQPVTVVEIRAALAELQAESIPASPSPAVAIHQRLVDTALEAVAAYAAFDAEIDLADGNPDPDRVWDAIAAIHVVLVELGQVSA